MEKVKSPVGRVFIHVVLILFAIYSLVPFYWTTLQSFKSLKDANSRTPKFFFTPTWENYQELWLRSVPENGAVIAYFLLLAVVLESLRLITYCHSRRLSCQLHPFLSLRDSG